VETDKIEALDRDRPAAAQVLRGKRKTRCGSGSGRCESENGCGEDDPHPAESRRRKLRPQGSLIASLQL
jgi:hypothetical protein